MMGKLASMLTLVSLICGGCGHKNLQFDNRKGISVKSEDCLAVPRFANFTSHFQEAGNVVADIAVNELYSRGFSAIIDSAEIGNALGAQNINLREAIDLPQALWLGQLLKADFVLVGEVFEYGYGSGQSAGNSATPAFAANARMVSVETKEVVWPGEVMRSGHDLLNGKRDPLTRVASLALEELFKNLAIEKGAGSQKSANNGEAGITRPCTASSLSDDMDRDKVLNLADRCPTRPEDANGVEDFDGCPEDIAGSETFLEMLALEGDRIVLKRPIRFLAGKTALMMESEEALTVLANYLIANSHIKKLMIEGFAKPLKGEKFKERFAFVRATAVKEFLVSRGVEEARLIAVGYGLVKSKNQQEVEFTIVE